MSSQCKICDKTTTQLMECNICGDEVCPSCQEQCSVCGQWTCHKHIVCVIKRVYVCNDCYASKLTESAE